MDYISQVVEFHSSFKDHNSHFFSIPECNSIPDPMGRAVKITQQIMFHRNIFSKVTFLIFITSPIIQRSTTENIKTRGEG
jgi:hypothetical protein